MSPAVAWGLTVAPYERTTSYLEGAAAGPREVLKDLEMIAAGEGISEPSAVEHLCGNALSGPRPMIRALCAGTNAMRAQGLLPVMLGGEHTCTLGPLTALGGMPAPFGVVHLDAHADQRAAYGGSRYSHASVMRRAVEDLGLPVLSIGIRAFCRAERDSMRKNGVGLVPGHRLGEWPRLLPPLLAALPPAVYLSIDMDFFDPAVVPGVGTPEPGGAGWYTGLDIVDAVLDAKALAGFDVVELCPPRERRISVRAASRLLLYVLERAARGGRKERLTADAKLPTLCSP